MRLDELEVFKTQVSPATRQRHLEKVAIAIRQRPPQRHVRRLTIILAAALLLIPLAALASEPAIPGEFLHPVKRFLEPAWLLIDGDVRARHRVEELEVLIERDGARNLIERQLVEAEAAVGDRPLLRQRLDRAREDLARGPAADEMRPTTTTTSVARPATVEPTTQPTRPSATTTIPPAAPPPTNATVVTRGSTRP